MVEFKEDLGLSLSLSFPQDQQQQQSLKKLNLTTPSLVQPSCPPFKASLQKPSWMMHDRFTFSDRNSESCRDETAAAHRFLCGIDVNSIPMTADCEEEAGVSSPNSTVSSISGNNNKRGERESGNNGEENEMERASSRGISDEEDGETSRKKLRLSKDQSAVLEESFKEHNTLNPKQKTELAKQLGLRPRQVEVWFQNRRARTKLKQTEVDCEFLKRCCENLTEENRRLQKEVQELRALKLSPHFYMQMAPPTTLTMCPSCERVGVPPTGPPSAVDPSPIAVGPAHHHHHRPIPIPWAHSAPIAHNALRPRS